MRKVYFRADGNSKMGLGHIYRSLALADMLKDDFNTVFITKNNSIEIKKLIQSICNEFVYFQESFDLDEEAIRLESLVSKNDIVVLDGYHFDTRYQSIIKPHVRGLVCIDDIHNCHFVSDVVINHSGGIYQNDYSAEDYTKFCLGLKYALLNKPFRDASRKQYYLDRKEGNIFICLGGADPNNETINVLRSCENLDFCKKLFVVIGSAYLYRSELIEYIEKTNLSIILLENISAMDMVYYMKKCPIAITPPSTVAYEYLSVGGRLFLKAIADNQKKMYNFFVEENLAFPLDDLKKNHVKTIKSYDLDGLQKERFLSLFNELFL